MKKYLVAFGETFIDMFFICWEAILNGMRNFTLLIEFLLPYLCLLIGQYCYEFRGEYAVGGEIFVPLICFFFINYFRMFANKVGKGISIPRPANRFTEVGEDGEVTVSDKRIEEMILYLADLEDWLERNQKKF